MSNPFVELNVVGHISTVKMHHFNGADGGTLSERHVASLGAQNTQMIPPDQISAVVSFNALAESGNMNKLDPAEKIKLGSCVVVYCGAPSVTVGDTSSKSVQSGLIVKGTLADMRNKLNPVSQP